MAKVDSVPYLSIYRSLIGYSSRGLTVLALLAGIILTSLLITVSAATPQSDTTGIYRGRRDGTSFTPAEGVEWGGGPYYWRIDENNADGTVTKGRVWSFTVADFILVDDFESYTDNDAENEAIWQHWIDGFGVPTNGAQVGYLLPPYAEQAIVHGGQQSMPLTYDNTAGVRNSEAVFYPDRSARLDQKRRRSTVAVVQGLSAVCRQLYPGRRRRDHDDRLRLGHLGHGRSVPLRVQDAYRRRHDYRKGRQR